MRELTTVVLGFIWASVLLTPLTEAQVGPKALAGVQARPQVSITVNPQRAVVSSEVDIHVRIANLTEQDIFLKEVELVLRGAQLAARGGDSPEVWEPERDDQLVPGTERLVPFRLSSTSLEWYSPLFNRHLLLFYPGRYDVLVRVTCLVPGAGRMIVIEETEVELLPPLASLLWGAIVGAALLGIFIVAYRYRRADGRPELSELARQGITFFATGTVCGVIVIMLLHRVGDLSLPVSLEVNDFYGGVVLGLFTYKLGDWLYTLFFGD